MGIVDVRYRPIAENALHAQNALHAKKNSAGEGVTNSEWLRGMPRWLKLVYLFVAIPAWLTIVYCVLTGQNKSSTAFAAFVIFAATALLHIIFDRRCSDTDESGITLYNESGEG